MKQTVKLTKMNLGLIVSVAACALTSVGAYADDFSIGAIFGSAGQGLQSSEWIIGGETVSANDPIAATTVALIMSTSGGTALCSGSLIAEDLVVTAGHCVGGKAANMRILFGRDIDSSNAPKVKVKAMVRPSDYGDGVDDKDDNDIGLVYFTSGLPEGYHTATLLQDADDVQDGMEVTLAGYGRTTGDANAEEDGAGVLRKVDVTVADAHWGKTEIAVDQKHGKGACHGDSGGPAFLNKGGETYLFGVTSRGPENQPDDCASLGIYTNILAHTSWIKTAADKLRKSH